MRRVQGLRSVLPVPAAVRRRPRAPDHEAEPRGAVAHSVVDVRDGGSDHRSAAAFVTAVRESLVREGKGRLPCSTWCPAGWGRVLRCMALRPGCRVLSYAVRWHGARPRSCGSSKASGSDRDDHGSCPDPSWSTTEPRAGTARSRRAAGGLPKVYGAPPAANGERVSTPGRASVARTDVARARAGPRHPRGRGGAPRLARSLCGQPVHHGRRRCTRRRRREQRPRSSARRYWRAGFTDPTSGSSHDLEVLEMLRDMLPHPVDEDVALQMARDRRAMRIAAAQIDAIEACVDDVARDLRTAVNLDGKPGAQGLALGTRCPTSSRRGAAISRRRGGGWSVAGSGSRGTGASAAGLLTSSGSLRSASSSTTTSSRTSSAVRGHRMTPSARAARRQDDQRRGCSRSRTWPRCRHRARWPRPTTTTRRCPTCGSGVRTRARARATSSAHRQPRQRVVSIVRGVGRRRATSMTFERMTRHCTEVVAHLSPQGHRARSCTPCAAPTTTSSGRDPSASRRRREAIRDGQRGGGAARARGWRRRGRGAEPRHDPCRSPDPQLPTRASRRPAVRASRRHRCRRGGRGLRYRHGDDHFTSCASAARPMFEPHATGDRRDEAELGTLVMASHQPRFRRRSPRR